MAVYFIQAGENGPVKIGFSAKPSLRFNKVAADNPEVIRVLGIMDGGKDVEREIHDRFAAHRQRGEWFAPDAGIVAFASTLARPSPKPRHRRRYAETALGRYLDAHNLSVSEFARQAGLEVSTAHRAVHGQVVPSPATIRAIREATKGAVTANDFHESPPRPFVPAGGSEDGGAESLEPKDAA